MGHGLSKNKQKIIDAAKKIIAEKGVNNTTLQAIADEAGISKGALYYHYKSKSCILYEVMDNTSSRAKRLTENSKIQNINSEEVKERMDYIIKKTVSDTSESRLFVHLIYEAILGDEELKGKFAGKYEQWVSSIEEILVSIYNVPKSPESRLLAMLVEATVDGFILKELIGVHREENDQALGLINLFFQGKLEEFAGLLTKE